MMFLFFSNLSYFIYKFNGLYKIFKLKFLTKRSINNFQNSIEEIAREVELENVKKDAEELLINEVSSLPNDVGELLKVEDDPGIPNLPKTQERKPKSAREISTVTNSKEKSDA